MHMVRHILGRAGAAMFVALLALVPTQAQAHSGHSHPAAATEQSRPAAPETLRAVLTQPRAAILVSAVVKVSPEPGDPRGCSDNCCKSAMSCCLVLLVSPLETLLPPEQAVPFPYPASVSSAGHDPDRLRRPPRSFT